MNLLANNDDTIELFLTPEQLLELSQAADMAPDAAPVPLATPSPRALRWHQTPLAKMAANTVAFVAFAWWSVAQLAGQPQSHPQTPGTAAARPLAIVSRPAAASPLPQPALQVVNPFDRTEVFEFPAGTSAAEGREKVAQILLQRARERQSHWEHLKPEVSLRTASLGTLPQ